LRQAYDYWQDQPDYYPQAIPLNGFSEEIPREWQSKVVRFVKLCMFLAATPGSNAPGSLKDECFHDLQPTRMRLVKRRWENPSAV